MAQTSTKRIHDWAGKVIHSELGLKCDHTSKWYMQELKSNLENKTHKFRGGVEIQTGYLIPTRRTDLVLINK